MTAEARNHSMRRDHEDLFRDLSGSHTDSRRNAGRKCTSAGLNI